MALDGILVTGGSGFLGVNLVDTLLARGARDVRVLDLAPFPRARPEVTVVRGDVRDASAVARAARGARFIVHAAAALPLSPPAEIHGTTVEGTRVVLAHGEAERVVFVSTTTVYGLHDGDAIDEAHPLRGEGAYARAKIEAERLIEKARDRGRCVSVLRPRPFVGPERLGVFSLLFEWAVEGRAVPVLGEGDNRCQLLDVDDLSDAIARCLEVDAPRASATFNIGAVEVGTMREDLQAVLDRAGHGRRVVGLPAAPLLRALDALHRAGLSPLHPWVYGQLTKTSIVSVDALSRALDVTPARSNADSLVRTFDWYVANQSELRRRPAGLDHRAPWRQGALGLAKRCF